MAQFKLKICLLALRSNRLIQGLFLSGLIVSVGMLFLQTKAFAANKFAMVIGINKYDNDSNLHDVPPLRWAVKDAEAIKTILIDKLGFDRDKVKLLPNDDAERKDILRKYYIIKKRMNADSEFILYFAGHGVRENDEIAGIGRSSEAYWMTYDTDLDELEVNGIRLEDVLRLVIRLPGKRKLIILDHCYAGDLIGRSEKGIPPIRKKQSENRSLGPLSSGGRPLRPSRTDPEYYKKEIHRSNIEKKVWTNPGPKATFAIMAASHDLAYEHDILGHGLLTWAIVQALTDRVKMTDAANSNLQRNGIVTLRELIGYTDILAREKKQELVTLGVEGISRQEFKFEIVESSEHIAGWPLLEIPDRVDIDAVLQFLEKLRDLNLNLDNYYNAKEILDEVKKQVDTNDKIAAKNCMGQKMFDRVNNTRKFYTGKGGVSAEDIGKLNKTMRDHYYEVLKECRKSPN